MRIKFLIYCFSFCLAANCLPKNDKVVHDDFEKLNSSFWYYNEKAWGFYSKDLDSMSFYNEVSKVHIDDELMQRNFELLQAVKYTYNQEYRKALLHLDTCINTFVTHQHAESLLKAYGLYAQVNNYLGKFEDSEVYTRLALEVAHQTRDSSNILKYTINLGSALLQNEKFDEGISIFRDAEKRLNQAHVLERGVVWYNLSKIYLYQGVFDLALGLSEKAIYWFERNELNPYLFGAYLNHCEILLEQGEWDLFLLCADKAASFVVYDFERSDLSFIKAEFSLKNDKFLEAKEYIKESIAIDSVSNPSKLGEDYLILAQISFKMHAYPEAFICVKKAIESFDNTNELININQAYHLFFKLLFLQEDNDDADTYFDEYLNNLKTLQDQQKNNILLKLEKEFRTKEKELIISNQEKLIASEGNKKRLLFFLLVAITFLLVTVLLFMRLDAKRKSLNEKNKGYMLNHKINALELSVLNQQLNPHDVKNTISTFNSYVLREAPSAYRKIEPMIDLINAALYFDGITETIQRQIQQVYSYIELHNNINELQIAVQINCDIDKDVKLPRLLLKNLVDNALRHGILPKKRSGLIEIQCQMSSTHIHILVQDDGVGYKQDSENGIGLQTYIDFFELHNQKNKAKAKIMFEDVVVGTKVHIQVPKDYQYFKLETP